MEIGFTKWHGTGNDFILIDDRKSVFDREDLALIQKLCDRHYGIGSDGLILIQTLEEKSTSFHMEFFNPDGSKSFCGNGSRCAFAFHSELINDRSPAAFTAFDGGHEGAWENDLVAITMRNVGEVSREASIDHINTGSPHDLVWVDDPGKIDLVGEGRKRRYDPARAPGGTNVNFLTVSDQQVQMRTYERGVEAETLSCGTGVVAAALSALSREKLQAPVKVITKGGELFVEAEQTKEGGWHKIRLIGPVVKVFKGTIKI